MPKATWTQTNFNSGEWSPLVQGRADIDKYKTGLAKCQNYIPTVQGGLARRPGTRFVAVAKDSANPINLVRFEFSVTQAYVLEFGSGYIRFYTQDGQLQNAGVPVEIVSPYTGSEVSEIKYAQSADTLYITHPNHPPYKLQRQSAYVWTITAVSTVDGPYLTTNTTTTTLTPAGTTGTVTVNASSTTGINGGVGFLTSDVGRLLRIKCGGVWLSGTIASRVNATRVTWTITDPNGQWVPRTATATPNVSGGSIFSVTVTDGGSGYGASPPSVTFGGGSGAVGYATVNNGVVTAITMSVTGTGYTAGTATCTVAAPTAIVASSTTFWRLGAWNSVYGYPSCVTFHQDRLVFAGSTGQPNTVWASNTSDYENFAPTNVDGTVVDSNAYTFTLNSNVISTIVWMMSDEFGLLCGTAGGEWIVSPSSTTASAMTPTNVNARMSLTYGSASVQPQKIGKSTLYIQRTGRKVREMAYQFVNNTFIAPDISQIGEHLTVSGIKQMVAQQAPQPILWMVLNNGGLTAMTYDKEQEVCGFTQHVLGGYSDSGQTAVPVVESVMTIPAPSVTRDEVWLVVQRYINGASVKYIEVMTKFWETGDGIANAVFLDSSAEYNGSPTTTISGLTWLKGQTVSILADGAPRPTAVVDSSGHITLDTAASKVQVGLGYNSVGKTLRIEAGGGEGPAQGKLKRIHRIFMRFFESIGISLQANFTGAPLSPMPFRQPSDPMDGPIALFSGDKIWTWEGSYEREGQLLWQQSDPLPSNILMVAAQLETQDQ